MKYLKLYRSIEMQVHTHFCIIIITNEIKAQTEKKK